MPASSKRVTALWLRSWNRHCKDAGFLIVSLFADLSGFVSPFFRRCWGFATLG